MRAIDADALVEHLSDYQFQESPSFGDNLYGNKDAYEAITNCINAIEEAPTIWKERKTGTWINHRNDLGHNIADCSECGNAIQWFDGDETPKFCCMCGADMSQRGDDNGKQTHTSLFTSSKFKTMAK